MRSQWLMCKHARWRGSQPVNAGPCSGASSPQPSGMIGVKRPRDWVETLLEALDGVDELGDLARGAPPPRSDTRRRSARSARRRSATPRRRVRSRRSGVPPGLARLGPHGGRWEAAAFDGELLSLTTATAAMDTARAAVAATQPFDIPQLVRPGTGQIGRWHGACENRAVAAEYRGASTEGEKPWKARSP